MKKNILEEKIPFIKENKDEFLNVREPELGFKEKFNYKFWIIVSYKSVFISLSLGIILKYTIKSKIFLLFFALTLIFSIILIILILFKIKRDKKEEEEERRKLQQEEDEKKRLELEEKIKRKKKRKSKSKKC